MLNDDQGPHDWEMKDEVPPERLQKKWEREEASGSGTVVCPSCKKETPAVPILINRSKAEIGAVQTAILEKKRKVWTENLTCIFCGTGLDFKNDGGSPREFSKASKTPWYARTVTLVVSFLAVGPFALPLVWFNPVYSRRKKIIVTVIVLVLTFVLVAVFLRAVGNLVDYYKQAGIF